MSPIVQYRHRCTYPCRYRTVSEGDTPYLARCGCAGETRMTMSRTSAGLLMYRLHDDKLQVLLAHPGGPFFKNKDDDTWTIPKGEPDPGEDLFAAALREFAEETCLQPQGPFIPLQPIQQKGG